MNNRNRWNDEGGDRAGWNQGRGERAGEDGRYGPEPVRRGGEEDFDRDDARQVGNWKDGNRSEDSERNFGGADRDRFSGEEEPRTSRHRGEDQRGYRSGGETPGIGAGQSRMGRGRQHQGGNGRSGESHLGSGDLSGHGGSMGAGAGSPGGGPHKGKGPKGYVRSDDRIREDVADCLTEDASLDASQIEVEVSGGEVTLTGTVVDRSGKRKAEELADEVSGVKHVQNNLRVAAAGGGEGAAKGTSAGAMSQAGMSKGTSTNAAASRTGASGSKAASR